MRGHICVRQCPSSAEPRQAAVRPRMSSQIAPPVGAIGGGWTVEVANPSLIGRLAGVAEVSSVGFGDGGDPANAMLSVDGRPRRQGLPTHLHRRAGGRRRRCTPSRSLPSGWPERVRRERRRTTRGPSRPPSALLRLLTRGAALLRPLPLAVPAATRLPAEPLVHGASLEQHPAPPVGARRQPLRIEVGIGHVVVVSVFDPTSQPGRDTDGAAERDPAVGSRRSGHDLRRTRGPVVQGWPSRSRPPVSRHPQATSSPARRGRRVGRAGKRAW